MKAWSELRRLPRRLWVLSAATLINNMGMMAMPFLPLYLTRELGFPASRAGAIMALYGAVAFITGPVSGRLCDRWGAGRMMTTCLALTGMCMLLYPFARSLGAVAAMTVIWAAATEAFRPAAMTSVAESAPADMRKQTYALHRLAINLGMSLGPALGGFLAGVSFKAIWAVNAAASLTAAALLKLLLEAPPAGVSAPAEGPPSGRGLSDPRLRWCLLATVPVSMVFFQHESSLPLHLTRGLGLSERFYGSLFTVNTLLIVALEIPLNHATARWPYARSLGLGAALFTAGFGVYGVATTAAHIIAGTVVWTFGEMILLPSLTSYISEIAPPERRGEYMGLYTMAFSFAFMVGPWAGILTLDHWGPGALWSAVFAIGAASTVMYSRIRTRA